MQAPTGVTRELGHQVGKRHLLAPAGLFRFLLDVLDVAGENSARSDGVERKHYMARRGNYKGKRGRSVSRYSSNGQICISRHEAAVSGRPKFVTTATIKEVTDIIG